MKFNYRSFVIISKFRLHFLIMIIAFYILSLLYIARVGFIYIIDLIQSKTSLFLRILWYTIDTESYNLLLQNVTCTRKVIYIEVM